jgi:hypothetical protein
VKTAVGIEESATMGLPPPTIVSFEGPAPGLSRIAEKIAELSGLEVSVEEPGDEVMADLYDLYGDLSFKCDPQDQLNIWVYRPRAVRDNYVETFGDSGLALPIANCMVGLNEPAETQAVYLDHRRDRVGALHSATMLALEALGGHASPAITEDARRRLAAPISASELLRQRRKVRNRSLFQGVILVLLLPVLIPLCVLSLLWFLMLLPWYFWKVAKRHRAFVESDLYRDILAVFDERNRAGENTDPNPSSPSEDQHQ